MKEQKYYLGLDIGTDSVGYAVANENYEIMKTHGDAAWGVTIFDAASLNDERRGFRSARRRLDRRQQRIALIRELFAKEIAKIDKGFFIRLQESFLFRDETDSKHTLFCDINYTDKQYYEQYPTIHHLIKDLMINKNIHDVRLLYIAVAWLVGHRGHFLNNVDVSRISEFRDFETVYKEFLDFFAANGYDAPWHDVDIELLADVLRMKTGVNAKNKALFALLFDGKKPIDRNCDNEPAASFPFSHEGIVKLLAGGTYALSNLFFKEEYASLDPKNVCLKMDDQKFEMIAASIGDDYGLIEVLRKISDWCVLVDSLGTEETISEAKVKIYEQHEKDLKDLKDFVRKYLPDKFNKIFRDHIIDNYVAYTLHSDEKCDDLKSTNIEAFSKYLKGIIKDISVEDCDSEFYVDMCNRLETNRFLPKQKNTDNRVIPHQLYEYELIEILKNASEYLPFLNEVDDDGLTISQKIISVFKFKIPYFVGPLNVHSDKAWIVRKQGKITPWNFEDMVDLDKSEDAFIKKLTNTCTYLPGESVLPKDSLLYHTYTVLNEINNIRINGERISVELKKSLYNDLFAKKRKVTLKNIHDYLIANGIIQKGDENKVTGIDSAVKSNLMPQIVFRQLLETKIISESDAERIIERSTYAEDKSRLEKWLIKEYPAISAEDRKYICRQKFSDFGRLSKSFLNELEGTEKETGNVTTIIAALWETQNNLMELLSDSFTFIDNINSWRKDYYSEHPQRLDDRLDEMYLSNAVKRPVYRTLAIVKDIVNTFGEPKKIMVEMTRGSKPEDKGKRTKSRLEQIHELYDKCDEDVSILQSRLEAMGENADSKLRNDKLFLYYMQLGRSMYSGKSIEIERLASKEYDIDHIYPQAYVKDDSVINNKVLVLSEENGAKSDVYPINENIRKSMHGFWGQLLTTGLISEEKYKRLTRSTPFTDEERYGFINRQLTETSQSTKAVAALLKERYPNTEIVYSKANLVSEFRQDFKLPKSRVYNDLHHAVDAYLNIVVGNVYNSKFTKNFNVHQSYSIKVKTLFTHPVMCGNTVVWDGINMLERVKATAVKNNAHFTKFALFKKGGLFDQMPVSAAEGLTPLKKGLPTERYGGYNKSSGEFFIPVAYKCGKKSDVVIMSVELLAGEGFLSNNAFAEEYTFKRLEHILGKKVDTISFPMGKRPWKINTALSLDGFRVCITGYGNGGARLLIQPLIQFSADKKWNYYLDKLEKFQEHTKNNPKHIYSERHDVVNKETNLELYDLYIDKFTNSIYRKRTSVPTKTLMEGRDKFISLSVEKQTEALLNIHQLFGRASGGVDLKLIGGSANESATYISATVSNWGKKYSDVRLIDTSVAGIYQKRSGNLLELL